MKHHNKNRTLGRNSNQRNALIKSLCCSLIRDGKIKTTEAKAKEMRPYVERLVTSSKNDTPSKRSYVTGRLGNKDITNILFTKVTPKYKDQNGGYTRIIKLPIRKSDSSKMALIEFV